MKRPEEFNEDQMKLVLEFRVYRLFSQIIGFFGPEFFLLYMLQHMDMDERSAQLAVRTFVLWLATVVVAYPFIHKHIHEWIMPLTILGCAIGLLCNVLLIPYPVVTIFIVAISTRSIGYFQKRGFAKLTNRIFSGDAKTLFDSLVNNVDALGLGAASVLCWLCSSVPLIYIVIADSILTVIDVWLVRQRLKVLQDYLRCHPYEERGE